MKNSIGVLIVCCLLFFQSEAQQGFNDSLSKAKKEHKLLLLNFSGSDWCIPCIQMKKEIFQSTAFRKLLEEEVMLVNADFPRKKINLPPKTIVQQNEWLAEKYNPTGSFPFTLLLDKEGKVLKRWDGKPEESANDFVQVIKSFYKQAY